MSVVVSREQELREIDAQIAAKVLGWRLEDNQGAAGGRIWHGHGGGFGDYHEGEQPHFSTEIDEAFKVLDRIHAKDPFARGERWYFSRRSAFYRELERLCSMDDGVSRFQVAWPDALGIFRDQIAEFICRAALAVVNEEATI